MKKKLLEGNILNQLLVMKNKDQKTSSMYSGVNIRAKTDLSTYTLRYPN